MVSAPGLERFVSYVEVSRVPLVGRCHGRIFIDLRTRVVRACDGGMSVAAVATRFEVSLAWVYRVLQRRRETGSITLREQTKFRGRALSGTRILWSV